MKKALVLFMLLISMSLFAQQPVQIGLFSPMQLHPQDVAIKGIKLNLVHSSTDNFQGLDVGFASQVNKSFKGIQWNWINLNKGNSTGIQLGEVFSSSLNMKGLQSSPVNHIGGQMIGLQLGIVNIIKGDGQNLQLGLINYNEFGFLKTFPFLNFNLK